MSPVALGSAFGAAALTVGRGAATALGNSLSFGAELLRAANGESTLDAGKSETEQSSLPQELMQRIDALTAQIRRQLTGAGIKLSRPLELTSNGAGGIEVPTDQSLHGAIQSALGNDFLLERDFDHLAADYAEFTANHSPPNLPPALVIKLPAAEN